MSKDDAISIIEADAFTEGDVCAGSATPVGASATRTFHRVKVVMPPHVLVSSDRPPKLARRPQLPTPVLHKVVLHLLATKTNPSPVCALQKVSMQWLSSYIITNFCANWWTWAN